MFQKTIPTIARSVSDELEKVKSGKRKIAGDKELMKGFLKASELYLYDIQSIMRKSIV